MDASMRQKIALTAAPLLCEGDVADTGTGSGSGSHALASRYPLRRAAHALEVLGAAGAGEAGERAGEHRSKEGEVTPGA